MKNIRIKTALVLGFILCVGALSAQTEKNPYTGLTAPTLFSPESAVYRASMGTISSDIDGFMSVKSFKDTTFTNNLFYLGLDPQGVTIGYGQKMGPVYFGIAYGGSLIQDLISRATNQDADDYVIDISTTEGDATPLVTQRGEEAAEIYSKNEFNIFLGLWRAGLKVGFSQVLTAEQPGSAISTGSYAGGFENSMVPSLSLGISIPLGEKMRLTPELFAIIDIHQFVSGSVVNDMSTGTMEIYQKYQTQYIDTKVGGRLAFTALNPNGKFELGSGFSLGKRMDNFDFTFKSGSTIDHQIVDSKHGYIGTVSTTVDNLEQQLDPYLLITTSAGEGGKLTAGVKIMADISINEKYTTPDTLVDKSYGDVESHYTETQVKPEIDLGVSFALLPNRFALHAGFGLNLWQFTISENTVKEALPSTKLAVGFTANINAETTIDMLLITSGEFDFKTNDPNSIDKFTIFITRKK
jgi:hypothetical protein